MCSGCLFNLPKKFAGPMDGTCLDPVSHFAHFVIAHLARITGEGFGFDCPIPALIDSGTFPQGDLGLIINYWKTGILNIFWVWVND